VRVRGVLILTGIVSSLLGALIVYLVLSVPNDLRADSMLKDARQDINNSNNDKARQSLLKIIQQYPRTDAAAAATAAVLALDKKERDDLARALDTLATQNVQQTKLIADLRTDVGELKKPPPPVVTVQAPAPKPAPRKTITRKKTPPKKTTRRRR
jgi:predicted RND superfamily exporter protein